MLANRLNSKTPCFRTLLAIVPLALAGHGSASHPLDHASGLISLYFQAPLTTADIEASPSWKRFSNLTKLQSEALTTEIWEAHRVAERSRTEEAFGQGQLNHGEQSLEFDLQGPATQSHADDLQPLTISLHGGGAISPEENDRQWRHQQERYSRVPGYYLCPRAPSDNWNLWEADDVGDLVEALVQQALANLPIDHPC